MNDGPNFFHVDIGGAERMLEVVLAAFEPGIFCMFVSGEVAVVLGVDTKHGAERRGGGGGPLITGAPPIVNRKIFSLYTDSWFDRKAEVRFPGRLRRQQEE